MKGVVFLGDRKLELREFPDPTPGPRDVILEIKASGMCEVCRNGLKHQRRSAAWTILLDWTFRSRRPASALWIPGLA